MNCVIVIVNATWTRDISIPDLFSMIRQKLQQPDSTLTIYKTLALAHHLLRSGAEERVMGYLCTVPGYFLRALKSTSYVSVPAVAQAYAEYLDQKIASYHQLKLDIVRSYSGSGKSARRDSYIPGISSSLGQDGRMKRLELHQGLIPEFRVILKQASFLVRCAFYDVPGIESDGPALGCFALCIEDLYPLFQALCEGIMNMLQKFFELNREDAVNVVDVYKEFILMAEKIIHMLKEARRLQSRLGVPVPSVKHVFLFYYILDGNIFEATLVLGWTIGRICQ